MVDNDDGLPTLMYSNGVAGIEIKLANPTLQAFVVHQKMKLLLGLKPHVPLTQAEKNVSGKCVRFGLAQALDEVAAERTMKLSWISIMMLHEAFHV